MWVLGFQEEPMNGAQYTDEQIVAVVKEGEACRKVAERCRSALRA